MKYGRLPRTWHPHVLHLSHLRQRARIYGARTAAPPVDYSLGMPAALGAMLNDRLGDCTIAGLYHRRQVVSFNTAQTMNTQPDSVVEKAYEIIDGYRPGVNDPGGVEQDVLAYCCQNGIPLADGSVDKLLTFVEIDAANAVDVDWAINDCLGVYTGFDVPAYLPESPGSTWDADPGGDNIIVGGHCVYVVGHLQNGNRRPISWGSYDYQITPAFWLQRFDEVYALIGSDLLAAKTGQTILGMTIPQLEQAIRELTQ
jgi:hypothetical protein